MNTKLIEKLNKSVAILTQEESSIQSQIREYKVRNAQKRTPEWCLKAQYTLSTKTNTRKSLNKRISLLRSQDSQERKEDNIKKSRTQKSIFVQALKEVLIDMYGSLKQLDLFEEAQNLVNKKHKQSNTE